jgi:ribosomal protein S18 acetylase RimI-like enzyme
MIGTPSQYSPSKMLGTPPAKLEPGSYFMNIKDPELVGSLYVKKYKESYVIRDVFVLPEKRGKGYGAALIRGVLAFLIPKKKEIILYVDPTNPAVSLYKKMGFSFQKKGAYGNKYVYLQ